VVLLKQEKVAALVDASASFALEPTGQALVTKPHGHGDVHLLLHASGLAEAWRARGKAWACFFQDTNGLVFKSMLAVLGVSKEMNLDLNSMCIPRLAKQEIGAITKLVSK
jgi:UDP-sugar pyrophosphorylase